MEDNIQDNNIKESLKLILDENNRLRSLLEEQRQKELRELRERLSESEARADHFRGEAERNASIGKEIAAQYEKRIAELSAKVEIYERSNGRPTTRPTV